MNIKKTIFNYDYIQKLSVKFNIPELDILLIALNRYGLRADIKDKRLRFKLRPFCHDETFYLAICINTYESPFSMANNLLYLGDQLVGEILEIEKDTCDTTYFRRNRTELTLNSNMRSQCSGCSFCGTYNLDPEDKVDMSTQEKIAQFVDEYLRRQQVKDLSDQIGRAHV